MTAIAPATLLEELQRSEAELTAIDPIEQRELALTRCVEIVRLSEQLEKSAAESRRRALSAGNRLALEILGELEGFSA